MIREAAGLTQEEFSKSLGVARDTYARYETRSLLPHHLVIPVCDLTGHDCYFLLTGRARPATPLHSSIELRKKAG